MQVVVIVLAVSWSKMRSANSGYGWYETVTRLAVKPTEVNEHAAGASFVHDASPVCFVRSLDVGVRWISLNLNETRITACGIAHPVAECALQMVNDLLDKVRPRDNVRNKTIAS